MEVLEGGCPVAPARQCELDPGESEPLCLFGCVWRQHMLVARSVAGICFDDLYACVPADIEACSTLLRMG